MTKEQYIKQLQEQAAYTGTAIAKAQTNTAADLIYANGKKSVAVIVKHYHEGSDSAEDLAYELKRFEQAVAVKVASHVYKVL